MRFLIQRVSRAQVTVDGRMVGRIGAGLLVLAGVTHDDDEAVADRMVSKLINLRLFRDEAGQMNRSVLDLHQEDASPTARILLVSQFTLYANSKKGRRPSYIAAARPEQAEPLVRYVAGQIEQRGLLVEQGEFGAMMAVELVTDGPVTIWLDSDEL